MGLRQRFQSLLNRLNQPASSSAVHRPLLNDIELQQLQQQALIQINNPFLVYTDVQHQLLGERPSSFSGSGYEFAEHRRYVAGDDPRFIDWRVMARTGKLHRKVFHEERRPQLYLVVDRRAAMRFGTRDALKVTRAVKLAIQLLTQARQQNMLTGAVLLEEQSQWIPCSQSSSASHNLVQQLNRPCPPLSLQQDESALGNVLHELAVRLTPGCIIYLVSDFHDLDDSASSVLYHLSQQHRLFARHILDPVEMALPKQGELALYDELNQQGIDIPVKDHQLASQFKHDMLQRQQTIKSLIEAAGGEYRLWLNEMDEHVD